MLLFITFNDWEWLYLKWLLVFEIFQGDEHLLELIALMAALIHGHHEARFFAAKSAIAAVSLVNLFWNTVNFGVWNGKSVSLALSTMLSIHIDCGG